MKLLFKNTTKYTKKNYDEFLNFHSEHYKYWYLLYTIFISCIIIFIIAFQVKIHNISISLIFCISLTLFILWRIFHPISEVKKEYESETIQEEKSFTFKFYEKKFFVLNLRSISEANYSDLYKVFETDTFFYLYIDKRHSLLLKKDCFTKGTSYDFSTFIKKKCWYKYKRIHKNKSARQ